MSFLTVTKLEIAFENEPSLCIDVESVPIFGELLEIIRLRICPNVDPENEIYYFQTEKGRYLCSSEWISVSL